MSHDAAGETKKSPLNIDGFLLFIVIATFSFPPVLFSLIWFKILYK